MSRTPRRAGPVRRLAPVSFLLPLAGFTAIVLGGLVAYDLVFGGGDAGAPLPPVAVERTTLPTGSTPSPGPDVQFDASGVDFGVVPLNTEVGYTFRYVNAGSERLRIEGVQVRVVEGC